MAKSILLINCLHVFTVRGNYFIFFPVSSLCHKNVDSFEILNSVGVIFNMFNLLNWILFLFFLNFPFYLIEESCS